MKKTLIKNALVINEGKSQKKDVLIQGEYISKVQAHIDDTEAQEVIDAKGLYLIPGLIDDQVHFREPGLTHKADIASESAAAVAGGITSFMEMPNTNPQTTTQEKLEEKYRLAENRAYANYGFKFGGTNDNLEELLRTDGKKVPGIKVFLGSSTGNMLVDNPETIRAIFSSTDLPISVHCEDEATIRKNTQDAIDKFGEDIPMEMHPEIRSEEACYLSSSQAVKLAKETGAHLHVFHLSTEKELELFDNTIPLEEKKITAEVCVHHLWFSDEDYKEKGSHIKWNPAVKKTSDREALWKALNDDRIDVLATDHAPHTIEEKNQKYLNAPSGGPLVQHALVALLEASKQGKISKEKLVEKACHNPAILFKVKDRGFIREGYKADLVLVNPNSPWTVHKDNILYKCGWSPFEGTEFSHRVEMTYVNGQKAYANGVVDMKHPYGERLEFNR